MFPHRCSVPATAEGVRASRLWARACCDRWGCTEAADAVVLVVDELVANAIEHGGTPASVTMAMGDGAVVGSVHDDGPGSVHMGPVVPDPSRVGGYGLLVVQGLTESWSVAHDQGGTTVSFRIAC